MQMKPVDGLTVADLRAHPVWEYTSGGANETYVRPIKRIPVTSLTGKEVGTEVTLANGDRVWALIGNVDSANPRLTTHFLTLSVERDGSWFHLARYHDFDADKRGPIQLAAFLGLAVHDVFPISYDLRSYVKGASAALHSTIPAEPVERLSRAEVIALAVP